MLVAGVKLMLRRVLKVSSRYLPSFLSYRENPAIELSRKSSYQFLFLFNLVQFICYLLLPLHRPPVPTHL